jgi:hypothetical protein
MAWGSKVSATQLTTISNTEQLFDVTPTLLPQETAHVAIDLNAVASTDNLVVSVYGSIDGTTWSITPIIAFEIDSATDPNRVDFLITGYFQFRVGVESAGSTDDHTSADMSYRLDGVSA